MKDGEITTLSYSRKGTAKGGDHRFEVSLDALMAWDKDEGGSPATKPRGENHYIPVALANGEEIRHTVRQNGFISGGHVKSYDLEIRAVNVVLDNPNKANKGKKDGTAGGNGDTMSVAERRELFVALKDADSLTALLVSAADMAEPAALKAAKLLIKAG